ncbi:MAG: hypothetical protein AABW79_03785 [Nanoarchaeota archaeon]
MKERIIKSALGYYLSAIFFGLLSIIFMTYGLVLLIKASRFEDLTDWRNIKIIIIGSGFIAISIVGIILIFLLVAIARGLKNKEPWAKERANKLKLKLVLKTFKDKN